MRYKMLKKKMKPQMKAFTNRYELKYILDWATYFCIRNEIGALFKQDPAAEHGGKYDIISIYYDTPVLDFFWQKLDGEKERVKVRMRTYKHPHQDPTKQDFFLELKKKRNNNVFKRRILLKEELIKEALQYPFLDKIFIKELDDSSEDALKEIEYLRSVVTLKPTVVITYTREPFVSKDNMNVRITFDSNVRCRDNNFSFTVEKTDKRVLSSNHIIMEIKYTDYFPLWLVHLIQKYQCHAQTFSKYCVGMEHVLKQQEMLIERGGEV